MRALLGLCAVVLLLEGFTIPPSNWIGTYGVGQLAQPFGVAVSADGSSYVTDFAANRVEKFSKAGTHLLGWGNLPGLGQLD
jgi:DNA-binding beta-propeller fold protein YncE